jgi:predicted DNA repair protein MutK
LAGSSLFALLDDIATILDDVSVMTKVAAKKTAGVLGDDLALNAQQVTGVNADRELPVVWAVAKGSAVNKAILVPAALAISAILPWAVTPLLMVGGLYLCFEGVEKLAHKFLHSEAEDEAHHAELTQALVDPTVDLVAIEKEKIKGAVRTDFILSAEIITISLGVVATAPFMTRVMALVGVGVLMTVGVYGLVAGIVKLDDAGLFLSQRAGTGAWARFQRGLGAGLLKTAPYLMKSLSIAGTVAMFLVGGGILTHGIPALHHAIEGLAHHAGEVSGIGGLLRALTPPLADSVVGILGGAVVLALVLLGKRVLSRGKAGASNTNG